MRHSLAIALTVSLGTVMPAVAQDADDELPTRSAVVREQYRVAEVVGLRRWTAEMVQDTIDKYAPGMSLFSHACAATLRSLGFAEAASYAISNPEGQRRGRRAIVLLIEPQDSALVRHRDLPRDVEGSAAPWQPLVQHARDANTMFQYAVMSRVQAMAGGPREVPEAVRDDSVAVRAVWEYLDTHASAADAAEARRTLENSPYLRDRMAAVAVLSSFPDDDATWKALTGALLESDGPVRSFSMLILSNFAEHPGHRPDWSSVAEEAHAVLNGSSLFQLTSFVKLLLKAGAGPELAAPLLRNGGHGLLMLAMVDYPAMSGPALELLRVLSQEDFGADVDRWRAWVRTL